MLIIDNFIPSDDKNKILDRVVYDDDKDSWQLNPLTKQGYVHVFRLSTASRSYYLIEVIIYYVWKIIY